ncbi:hypothetical protein RND81_10G002500 [Saponaria officinalis]|uniref:BAG domain-containing protein n=1 Tax=Saponaria officinalis TaxID=3572 RepID=A0AAW1HXF1_SAPOF
MKSTRRPRYSTSSLSSTVTYKFTNDNSTPPKTTKVPITVHFHDHSTAAAAKIQAAYRAHTVRHLLRKIWAVEAETDNLEQLIQRQETVDAVRSKEKEKLRINEALMSQLLKLDSIPGYDPGVRELRRRLSRRIVALQEVMDGICGEMKMMRTINGWDEIGQFDWDEVIGRIEEDVCRERGGDELNAFCAHHLGFRCFQRFLSHP